MAFECDGSFSRGAGGELICSGDWVSVPAPLTELYELLNSAFSTPPIEDIQIVFMAAFAIPMICWLTSWGYQSLISWFERPERYDDSEL